MDNEQFKSEIKKRYGGNQQGRILAGFFVLLIGVVFLLKQMGYVFPPWLFTWPMILIAIGVFSALRHGLWSGAWIFFIIGGIFLADYINPNWDLHRFIWPMAIITVGLFVIFKPKSCRGRRWERRMGRWEPADPQGPATSGATAGAITTNTSTTAEGFAADPRHLDGDDFVDVTSVFGGVKKIVVSKNFRGADITCFMGGAEINLSQADIQGTARIDATNIFGGTKLIVPPTWEVKAEASAIFGGVDDKREIHTMKPDPTKVLILDGTCIFGGIEIRSY